MNAGNRTDGTPTPGPAIAAFADALDAMLEKIDRVLLTGPIDPDGDSLGACLALARGINTRHPRVQVDVAGRAGWRYAWMPGAEQMLADGDVQPHYDLVVVLDGDRHRLEPPVDAAFSAARYRGIVDHHGSTTPDGYDLPLIDRTAASTCQMIYTLLQMWGITVDRDLAALLYTGIIFDTGGFRHSNTGPATHRLAARLLETGIDHTAICLRVLSERSNSGLRLLGDVLQRAEHRAGGAVAIGSVPRTTFDALGAQLEDLEGLVDALLHTRGVEVSCLFIEKAPGRVKLSLRSRSRVDVAALAAQLADGGGGHARAAGVLLREDLSSAWARVPPQIEAALRATEPQQADQKRKSGLS